jgi:hypothetical protein
LLLLYLLSPNVRTAFGVTEPRSKWLVPAFALLTLVAFAFDFWHSGPELNAMRWHMHHGSRVTVNGVGFPVYYWYVPRDDNGQGLAIEDQPGPLRPGEKRSFTSVNISEEAAEKVSPEQMIDRKIQEYKRTGYPEPRTFQMHIAKQTVSCIDGGMLLGHRIDCYGTGPISSVFFAGGDRALMRFNTMMAEAR